MAKIVLIGLERATARQICRVLDAEGHTFAELPLNVAMPGLLDADIVFSGGEKNGYMPLLKRVRETRPSLPFVVVSRIPETSEWLDALEGGATDYCAAPVSPRQLRWLMESAAPQRVSAGAPD